MPYTKTTWVNGVTKLNATNMNKIEDGIFNAVQFIETPTTQTTTLNSTTPIVSVTDSVDGMADVEVGGATLNQIVVNGDFANGTTGWSGSGATLSATSKVLSITGTGVASNGTAFNVTNTSAYSGQKTVFKVKVRVTNANCTSLSLRTGGSTGGTVVLQTISNPVQNQWYNLVAIDTFNSSDTGTIRVDLRHDYADAATANGKVMEVDGNVGVFAVPMTGTPYEAETDANLMNNRIGEYWEGLKSVERVDVVSSGRNLFDGIATTTNTSITSFSKEQNKIYIKSSLGTGSLKYRIKVKSQSNYSISGSIQNVVDSCRIRVEDENGSFIASFTGANISFNTGSNKTVILSFTSATGAGAFEGNFLNIQLNEGSTALTYQPYDGSKLTVRYTDRTKFDGALLPNGRDNEVNISKGYISAVKRVQRYVLQSADVAALTTTGVNTDYVTVTSKLDAKAGSASTIENQMLVSGFSDEVSVTSVDLATSIGKYIQGPTTFLLIFQKGTYANLAAAQAALAGTVIYYELAQPIFIPYESFGTYGIEVDGTVSVSDDYTQLYLDNYNLLPPTPIVYPTNIAASVQGLKNAVEILNTKVDTVFLEGQATTDNTGWTASGNARFPFRKNVAITGVAATHVPIVNFTLATYTIAEDANIAYTESYDGGVTLYAETTPTGSVTFDYSIIRG